MDRWDAGQLARLQRLASDVTALDACIEVLRRRRPDETVARAAALIERVHDEVTALIEHLRA